MLLDHELYLADNAMELTLMFSCRGTDQEGEETGVKVGELVSGTVAHVADKVFILDVLIDKELMKGILTFPHLSDTSGNHCSRKFSFLQNFKIQHSSQAVFNFVG
jgi:hypothetical protein